MNLPPARDAPLFYTAQNMTGILMFLFRNFQITNVTNFWDTLKKVQTKTQLHAWLPFLFRSRTPIVHDLHWIRVPTRRQNWIINAAGRGGSITIHAHQGGIRYFCSSSSVLLLPHNVKPRTFPKRKKKCILALALLTTSLELELDSPSIIRRTFFKGDNGNSTSKHFCATIS
jgi:hypothetical protein